jgi:hypothetical protein
MNENDVRIAWEQVKRALDSAYGKRSRPPMLVNAVRNMDQVIAGNAPIPQKGASIPWNRDGMVEVRPGKWQHEDE